MSAPICFCLLGPHLSLPVEFMSPSVSACWIYAPCPLPVRYGSPPASAFLRPCPHLSLLVGCVLFLPPLAGYVPLSIPACWARVPSHLCLIDAHLHLPFPVDACLCLLGVPLYLPLHVRCLSLCVGYLSTPQQLCWHRAFPLQTHGEDDGGRGPEGSPQAIGRGGKRGRERGKIVGLELGNHRPRVIGRPELGPAPALTLHIRLGPGHLRGSPGRCLLLPWCLGPAGRMEQDPKPPRLRLWALLPWLPRKQRPRTSQTSLPAPGPGSGPRRDSVSVPRCLVLAWLWPSEQVPGQRVWPQLAFGCPGPGLALLDDWTLPRLASWGSEEALRGSRAIAADWREGRRVPVQLGSGKGVFSRLL